jgi:hypothetical protein
MKMMTDSYANSQTPLQNEMIDLSVVLATLTHLCPNRNDSETYHTPALPLAHVPESRH